MTDDMRIVAETEGRPEDGYWILGDDFHRLNKNIFWTGLCTSREAAERAIHELRRLDMETTNGS